MKNLKLWWYRNFYIITNKKAEELKLIFWRNVYGDEINRRNCRAIWFDHKHREYRVRDLEKIIPQEQLEKERNANYKYFSIDEPTSSQTTSEKWKEYQDWLNEPPEISDEEIEKAARDYDNSVIYGPPLLHFEQGAFWYREQLKSKSTS